MILLAIGTHLDKKELSPTKLTNSVTSCIILLLCHNDFERINVSKTAILLLVKQQLLSIIVCWLISAKDFGDVLYK